MAIRTYPRPRKVDQVDLYHGTNVRDPYRWMEDVDDPDLDSWLRAQDTLTESTLAAIECRDRFRSRIAELSRVRSFSTPLRRGQRWFQARTDPTLEQAAAYVLDDPEGDGRMVLDPATLDEGVLLANWEPSPDGSLLLYAESIGGSDWRTWRVLDVDTGRRLDDEVRDAKLWARWLPSGDGFLYIAFHASGTERSRPTTNPQLRLHRLGTPQDADEIVYENRDDPRYFFPVLTTDGRYLVLTLLMAPGAGIAYAPLDGRWEFRRMFSSEHDIWFCGSRNDTFYVCTPQDAPYGRVVAVDLHDPDPGAWTTVVAPSDEPLPVVAHACVVADGVFVAREHLGRSRLEFHTLDGSAHYDIELPGVCRFVAGDLAEPVSVSADGESVYFTVTSPSSPATMLCHDLRTHATRVAAQTSGTADLAISSEVVWARSRDGTSVPMTLVRSAGTASASWPAVIIEGYGGGGDSMHPYDYVSWKLAWLESGGVVASAHLRGGSELGAEWRAAAARGGKLKAMEDFVGCAELLVREGITQPQRIAVTGRSSGAMLAAAAVICRPELFGACVAEVGMFDPLRYHLFGLGRLMISEYGISDDADDFAAMHAYSPLHNLRAGQRYPAFLLTVHTDDDRVAPGQGYKFAAALQEAQSGDAPILLRVRAGAGHFGGERSGDIDERGDILAFCGMALDVDGC